MDCAEFKILYPEFTDIDCIIIDAKISIAESMACKFNACGKYDTAVGLYTAMLLAGSVPTTVDGLPVDLGGGTYITKHKVADTETTFGKDKDGSGSAGYYKGLIDDLWKSCNSGPKFGVSSRLYSGCGGTLL